MPTPRPLRRLLRIVGKAHDPVRPSPAGTIDQRPEAPDYVPGLCPHRSHLETNMTEMPRSKYVPAEPLTLFTSFDSVPSIRSPSGSRQTSPRRNRSSSRSPERRRSQRRREEGSSSTRRRDDRQSTPGRRRSPRRKSDERRSPRRRSRQRRSDRRKELSSKKSSAEELLKKSGLRNFQT